MFKEELNTESTDSGELENFYNLITQPKELYDEEIKQIRSFISNKILEIINKSNLQNNYQFIFLYDLEESIEDYFVDKIDNALNKDEKKDTLFILCSRGGSVESAYLISKCCKRYSKKFIAVIPGKAKSAATLLALGADEIHMGARSQLGPIDPQFGGLPALATSNAVEYLASVCKKYPESSDMFAKYLSYKLELSILGYFERVTVSSVQYAKLLLGDKKLPDNQSAETVARDLVYSYKDHNFVIDDTEAKKYLGDMIKTDTNEYNLANEIYRYLEKLRVLLSIVHKMNLAVIGTVKGGISINVIE